MRVRDKRFIFLAVFLLLVARVIGGPLPYALFYVFSGVALVSFLWTRSIARNLTCIYQVDRKKVSVGEELSVKVRLYNEGILPVPWIAVTDEFAPALSRSAPSRQSVLSLGAFGSAVMNYPVVCRRRGYHRIGAIRAVTGDPFGIFCAHKQFYESSHVTVYPRAPRLEVVDIPPRQPFGHRRTRHPTEEDPSSLAELRPFRPGDNPKRIDWKTTARMARPYVKVYELRATTDLFLILDMNRRAHVGTDDASTEETAIEIAAGVARYAAIGGLNFSLVSHEHERRFVPLGKGLKNFHRCMEVLCRAAAEGEAHVSQVVMHEARYLPRGSTAFIITPDADSRLLRAALHLRQSGIGVVVIALKPETYAKGWRVSAERATFLRHAAKAGVIVRTVGRGDDIARALGGIGHGQPGARA